MPSRTLAFLILAATAHAAEPANWPQFRGADSRGVAASADIPDRWSATENVEWKTEIPGRSWSSPIVWGDRIFSPYCEPRPPCRREGIE